MNRLSVSFGQSFNVMANGVRLNGDPMGFSEFFQSTTGLERGETGLETETSGLRVLPPD
jgi:hypothetical protein